MSSGPGERASDQARSGAVREVRARRTFDAGWGSARTRPADACRHRGLSLPVRRAFSLIELLVVIAVIAVLVALAAPGLAAARGGARGVVCLANLRQIGAISSAYADENKGRGPALGAPYTALPNWALVVQQGAGVAGTTTKELYSVRSVLVCPAARAAYALPMTRTYAVNATGHAGLAGDPDSYDGPAGKSAHVRTDLIQRPGAAVAFVDSAIVTFPDGPPPTQCSSVLDFRQSEHVARRIGRFHGPSGAGAGPGAGTGSDAGVARLFQGVMYDGSCRPVRDVSPELVSPLP